MKNANNYLTEMGKRMRKIRLSKNISIEEMHRRTGFAASCITEIEKYGKNAHLMTLKIIADVLQCDVKDFL
ncbi:MAG TPA: helix-turn-helix transcriptional regulator [Bacteroidia bacterium]|nr:helix-turn-helix transcriptional regulator [Bacteroidia bacterium]